MYITLSMGAPPSGNAGKNLRCVSPSASAASTCVSAAGWH